MTDMFYREKVWTTNRMAHTVHVWTNLFVKKISESLKLKETAESETFRSRFNLK